ncbi:MAG: hypothetical protein LLG13_01170 [Bacteroidales bacterium]|nr:hypothetical protein [Bacteroidales bacterium]
MITDRDHTIIDLLRSEWALLESATETLHLSIIKCQLIGTKESYTFEEMESFDSLTSKFNRTSDIFTQKVIRTVLILLHEPFAPFIDMMNRCEKMLIIRSADQMIEIRDLRNQIAHEYIPEAIRDLVPDIFKLTSQLDENVEDCRHFIMNRGWIETHNRDKITSQ